MSLPIDHTKDAIKNRMLKSASQMWGVKNIEELDPVVKLMVEAQASEIYRIHCEIGDMNSSLLSGIANSLTPETMISARPAHAIMHINIGESETIIDKYTSFFTENRKGIKDIRFSPVTSVKLVNARISHMICGRSCYSISTNGVKDILFNSSVFSETFNNTVWIGIDTDENLESLQGMSFYFDFPTTYDRYNMFSLLPYTKWEIGEISLQMEAGLPLIQNNKKSSVSIFQEYDIMNVIDSDILDYYHKQFLTVSDNFDTASIKKESFPAELQNYFHADAISSLTKPLIWIKLGMPTNLQGDIMHEMTVFMNAFPVANKIRINTHAELDQLNMVSFPSQENESFLAIESVKDILNRAYSVLPSSKSRTSGQGNYIVKRGGIERFDKRDALNYLERLTDLVRDEKAAFSSLKLDTINDILANMGSSINLMEQKISGNISSHKSPPIYLLIKPFEDSGGLLFIDYWNTNCERANGVRSGTRFKVFNNILLTGDGIFLLTASKGGQNTYAGTETTETYKLALTTRNRIVTRSDIISFCTNELSGRIDAVKVKNGISIGIEPNAGCIRTIDIYITPKPEFSNNLKDKTVQGDLLRELERRSSDLSRYRIFIK